MNLVFNKNHYNSDYGMITYIWGPLLWHFLHIISFNYPVNPNEYNKKNNLIDNQIQNSYYYFIFLLQFILPCKTCRDNLKKNLNSLHFFTNKSTIMKNRTTFSKFIFNLHETVNHMLNKKSNLKYEQVRDFYEHFRADCSKKSITHKGCDKLGHDSALRVKPKVVIYFVPFETNIKTTKIHKKCKIKCVYT